MKRKAISKRVRFEIFKRDKFTCQYCGATPPKVVLHIDHIMPVASGGGNEDLNLITACESCNQGKSDKSLNVVPASLQDQMATAKERQEQVKEYNRFLIELREAETQSVIALGKYWCNFYSTPETMDKFVLTGSWETSLRTFIKQLPVMEIADAMDLAHNMREGYSEEIIFKYFCGICWRKIKGDF